MDNLFSVYRSNVLPAMLTELVNSLGLRLSEPFTRLGIGFDLETLSWIFPQRNTQGELTGLLRRYPNGDKRMMKDSKLGYCYVVNPNWIAGAKDQYTSGANHWNRIHDLGILCPVCGHDDWCTMTDDGNAVICPRTPGGATKNLGDAGYLHVLHESLTRHDDSSILYPSDLPVLIVEGSSDWATAEELGFVAVGKPSAHFDTTDLCDLVRGRDVVIIGDNDAVGIPGMEATFVALTAAKGCKSITKLLPPSGIKDLRLWYTKFGLTQAELFSEIQKRGVSDYVHTTLSNSAPLDIGKEWLKTCHTQEGVITLRNLIGQWVSYHNGCYQATDSTALRGSLYAFLEDKFVIRDGKLVPVGPTRAKVSDIFDALNRWCFLEDNPPYWLSKEFENEPINPKNLVVFKNGMLDIDNFINGADGLLPLTPRLFTVNQIPFNFTPDAKCPLAEETLWDAMSQDEDKFNLAWEWLGHNFISDMSMEKIMLLVGRPRSGKGTYLSMMENILGKNQYCSTTFGALCSQFGRHSLMGKLAAIMPDATIPKGIDSGVAMEVVKKISGGDAVDIDRKYRDQLGAVNLSCRFTISVNTIPELPDHARALESRLLILTFKESYLGREDRSRKQRLREEAEGIIMRSLLALRALKQRKQFTFPADSLQMFDEFRLITTPMTQFIDECCVIGSMHTVNKYQLFDCWRIWAEANGTQPGTQPHFSQKLLSLFPAVRSNIETQDDRHIPIFEGISLNTWGRRMLGVNK